MDDIEERFRRSAEWQAAQKDLPYPEKIRMAEAFRESLLILKKSYRPTPAENEEEQPVKEQDQPKE
jgi:hypothetical protein